MKSRDISSPMPSIAPSPSFFTSKKEERVDDFFLTAMKLTDALSKFSLDHIDDMYSNWKKKAELLKSISDSLKKGRDGGYYEDDYTIKAFLLDINDFVIITNNYIRLLKKNAIKDIDEENVKKELHDLQKFYLGDFYTSRDNIITTINKAYLSLTLLFSELTAQLKTSIVQKYEKQALEQVVVIYHQIHTKSKNELKEDKPVYAVDKQEPHDDPYQTGLKRA